MSGFGWWRYRRWAAALAVAPVLALAGVNQAMAEPSFDEAQPAYERREFDAAYRMFSELAADGHPDAQNLLGVMYENSDGVALDFAKAASWYEKAARQGHAEAQLNLGVLFENGEGVPRSEERAAYRKWTIACAIHLGADVPPRPGCAQGRQGCRPLVGSGC